MSLVSFVVSIESLFFETHTSSFHPNTFGLLCRVCPVFLKAGRGRESYLSASFMCFPLNHLLCVVCVFVGRCVGVFMAPFPLCTPPPSLHPFPLLLNLSFPSCSDRLLPLPPLFLFITPAVMRLNLSVSTGRTHTLCIHTHTHTQRCSTHTIIHLKESTLFSLSCTKTAQACHHCAACTLGPLPLAWRPTSHSWRETKASHS